VCLLQSPVMQEKLRYRRTTKSQAGALA
jgi:hypothetical protein